MKLKQKLKKAGCLSLAILATLTLYMHPIKQTERPYEPEISICCGDDEPVELPLDPDDPKPH